MSSYPRKPLKVGIGGLGAIGDALVQRLDSGVEGLLLTAVAVRDPDKLRPGLAKLKIQPEIVSLGELALMADVVVECAPAGVFDEIAVPAIDAGRIFVPASVGALLDRPHLTERARETGAKIIVPTGALLGLDAVRAAAEGQIHSVRMVTRKPPGGLKGAPFLDGKDIDLDGLTEPLKLYNGPARDGVKGFPANVNVAAALSLAGIGPDKTEIEIWADPSITRNIHRIIVESDSARLEMIIENIPSKENPRTGRITALSILATLRALTSPLKVGT
ncbi:MAG: aspartate dehydrogenase [Rhodospirillales bacterium]|jgi:aspartate dehydrogenase